MKVVSIARLRQNEQKNGESIGGSAVCARIAQHLVKIVTYWYHHN